MAKENKDLKEIKKEVKKIGTLTSDFVKKNVSVDRLPIKEKIIWKNKEGEECEIDVFIKLRGAKIFSSILQDNTFDQNAHYIKESYYTDETGTEQVFTYEDLEVIDEVFFIILLNKLNEVNTKKKK